MRQPAGLIRHSDPSTMHIRSLAGREIYFDEEEFFWDPDDWSEEVAEAMAKESGLDQLGEAHRRVIRFLREFYYANGRAPLNRILRQGTGMSLTDLERLFPGGIKYGARRLAGLPNPRNCM